MTKIKKHMNNKDLLFIETAMENGSNIDDAIKDLEMVNSLIHCRIKKNSMMLLDIIEKRIPINKMKINENKV